MEVTNKVISPIKDKKGSSMPLAVAVTLSLVLVFSGISEYLRLLIIAQGVRDAVQSAIISTVVENYDDVYHGVREGYSGGYQPMAGKFDESFDYGDIYDKLDNLLGLSKNGSRHEKKTANGNLEFRIWNLNVHIRNAPFASADNPSARFEADADIMLEVPVSFGKKLLPPMRIKVETRAGYTPKF